MDRGQIEATFDQQAGRYDEQWARLAPWRDGLHLLMAAAGAALPPDARMLCVGAGTGAEIEALARRFPRWSFVAVEPSTAMVAVARDKAQRHGWDDRCTFHAGYLDTLPAGEPFHAASSLLVSQFLLDTGARTAFFRDIGQRLRRGGLLVTSDLAWDPKSPSYPAVLTLWMRAMADAEVPPQRLQQMREAYERDVAILPPAQVAAIVQAAGFDAPVPVHQAGLIHAWITHRRDAP